MELKGIHLFAYPDTHTLLRWSHLSNPNEANLLLDYMHLLRYTRSIDEICPEYDQ